MPQFVELTDRSALDIVCRDYSPRQSGKVIVGRAEWWPGLRDDMTILSSELTDSGLIDDSRTFECRAISLRPFSVMIPLNCVILSIERPLERPVIQ